VLPETSKASLREWRTTTSPTAAFIEECCDEGDHDTHEVLKNELFDAWTGWSKERGLRPLAKSRFFERVKANAPFVLSDTYEKNRHKFSVYRGLKLKRWAAKQYTGRPE
jgi:phage/plasmid-associated DNA primase